MTRGLSALRRLLSADPDRPNHAAPAGLDALEARQLLSSVTITNDLDFAIPDQGGGSAVSRIVTQLPSGSVVTGIDVTYATLHPRGSDLNIMLREGGPSTANTEYLQWWSNDAAANPGGTRTGIARFNGIEANTTWNLVVVDNTTGFTGSIDSFTVTVHYEQGLAAPATTSPGSTISPWPQIATVRPTFQWQGVPGATGYKIYLRNNDGIDARSYTVAGANTTSFTPPDDLPADGYSYGWAMTTLGGPAEGPRSEYRYFRTPTALAAPALNAPGSVWSGATVAEVRPAFRWSVVPGATHYRLTLTNTTTGTTLTQDVAQPTSGTAIAHDTGVDLTRGHSYSWHVRAYAGEVPGTPSRTLLFTVQLPALAAPTTLGPGGPSASPAFVVDTPRPQFTWLAVSGATGYRLSLCNRSTGNLMSYEIPAGATSFTPPVDLASGDTYEWWMTSINATNVASANSASRFFSAPSHYVPPPIPIFPDFTMPPGQTVDAREATFRYDGRNMIAAEYFQIRIRDLDSGADFWLDASTQEMSRTAPPDLLLPGRRYSWHIASVVNGRAGRASVTCYFQTAAPVKLSGTTIGTAGSYNNLGNTRDRAFDGSTSTFFDAPSSSGGWVGKDLGSARALTSVRFHPRANLASRMVGGKFRVSTDGVSWIDAATITTTPAAGWSTINFAAGTSYRYVAYFGPGGSWCNVAEIEFYGTGATTAPTPTVDLTPQNVAANPTSAPAGGAATVTFAVRNLGNTASTSTTARIELVNGSGAVVATLADGIAINAIAAGAAQNLSRSVTIPAGTAAGSYTLRVRVAPNGGGGQTTGATGNDAVSVAFGVTSTTTPTTPVKLTGTVIGTAGSYNNLGNTRAKAFDGSTSSYFDAPSSSGGWVGLDLGSPRQLTSARYYPRSTSPARMVGGKFQASADGVNWIDLATITSTPAVAWNTINFTNPNAYRYVRYLGPASSWCNVAELEFFGR